MFKYFLKLLGYIEKICHLIVISKENIYTFDCIFDSLFKNLI